MSPSAIRVCQMTKGFRQPPSLSDLVRGRLRGGWFTALDGINLEVARGEAFGLMGPNGAGKSTLLRILAGLLVPTSGTARVGVHDTSVAGTKLARTIGYVAADERGVKSSLSPREHLAWYAALYGYDRREALRHADLLLERVGLDSKSRRPLRQLSTGMQRRASLARALLGRPEVLLLDEPTRGLDPKGAALLHDEFRDALAEGRTILMATHDRHEARAICHRVATLERGRIADIASPGSERLGMSGRITDAASSGPERSGMDGIQSA